MKYIETNKAPKAIGAYAQGVMTNDTLYVSGQLPLEPETMKTVEGIETQTKRSLDNILAIVEAAGLKKENIVRCGIFLDDMNEFKEMNEIYGAFFQNHTPARAAVEVRRLPKDVKIEIDAIAVK